MPRPPNANNEPRRGTCTQCYSRALVQMAWIRHGATAVQQPLCRRCWQVFMRNGRLMTPQAAGKRNARHQRIQEARSERIRNERVYSTRRSSPNTESLRTCPHMMEGMCGPCVEAFNRSAQEYLYSTQTTSATLDSLYAFANTAEASRTIRGSTSDWSFTPMPEINEEPEEDEVLF